ncbi:hypothetical protein HYH02_003137 [Chlamydomonas schloesseri]|uniref:Uncharacterized protein n=1 Tax=Chlamydomonas schloesseri TaxID=2026947 RepID=A0A835WRN9_9CHLO|nr:hypothetical protein HYH02_003137 [Chlamydomonas schloesseri]|eukprot:KAG2452103.1 hypothetical protein HYH02_003137 [Chlamydomonas schloesseri]
MQQRLLKPHTAGLRPSGAAPVPHGLISGSRVQQTAPSARAAAPGDGKMTSHPVAARGLARDILTQQAASIEGNPIAFLDVTEKFWKSLRNQKHEPEKKGPKVVTYANELLFPEDTSATSTSTSSSSATSSSSSSSQHPHDYDVVICGGTLGLFLATALQLQGWRVAIVEKRLVQGRNQEWNISWGELEVLTELGLLSEEELKASVISEFNPIRVGFKGGEDMWTQDVLNLGVHPRTLLDSLKRRFHAAGGVIFENTAFKHADVHPDGIKLSLAPGGAAAPVAVGDTNRPNGLTTPGAAPPAPTGPVAPRSMTTRLLLDCMGHYSDIVKQIRGRVKPDGMVLVVGGCAEGFPAEANVSADLLYSLSHARDDVQLFWEAFPAEGGRARTTYMFAYSDAHPDRPTFEALLDTYFQMLPEYQNIPLEQLKWKRVLFGGFPCYSNGPLAPAFDRVMQIGDASAAQSPLSFGGFGSMMRHLPRLARGLNQALREDRLARPDLQWLHPYQPSLSASWLFQRSMSLAVGQAAYPADYPHAPAYYAAAQEAKAAAAAAAAERAEGFDGLVSTASEKALALQEAAMEAVEAVAVRFAAGSADPADYFHVEQEVPGASDKKGPALASGKQQPPPPKLKKKLFERDFRTAPDWQRLPYTHVNEILGTNFGVMGVLGDRVLKPFLQDTIQLVPLSLSMTGMMLSNPVTVSRVLMQVGPKTLVAWFAHYFALVAYSLGHVLLSPLRGVIPSYTFQRMLDALEYGSGSDYRYHAPAGPAAGAAVSAGAGGALPAALSAAVRSMDGGAATDSVDGGEAAAEGGQQEGGSGKAEGGSVKGRKAPKQQPAAEPVPLPVPVAAATAAAVAMAAATMVVGLPGVGPVTLG